MAPWPALSAPSVTADVTVSLACVVIDVNVPSSHKQTSNYSPQTSPNSTIYQFCSTIFTNLTPLLCSAVCVVRYSTCLAFCLSTAEDRGTERVFLLISKNWISALGITPCPLHTYIHTYIQWLTTKGQQASNELQYYDNRHITNHNRKTSNITMHAITQKRTEFQHHHKTIEIMQS